MKPLKSFRQTPGLCGPASLKILLSHYGKDFTEEELARLCHTTAEKGTNHADLIEAIKALGEHPIAQSNATIEDLRSYVEREIPVIVGWYSTFGTPDDHYSVVYDLSDESVSMMDPEAEDGRRTLPIHEFKKAWYDFDGPENTRVDRWMLAIPTFEQAKS